MAEITPGAPAAAAPTPPAPGTPEHDAAMAKVAEGRMAAPAAGTPPEPAKRPDHIPEKFWDAEKGVVRVDDLAKAHHELETKVGKPAPAAPATPAKAGEALAVDADAAQKAGLDMEALNAEFAEKGVLSPETLQKLEAGGIPKAMVDSYIEGQKALAVNYEKSAHDVAGGAEKFKAMKTWAATNLTPAEAKAYNEAVGSGDVGKMQLAVTALRSKFTTAEGDRPALVTGSNSAGGDVGYNSRAEMTADMRKPEYKKDAAFRASVERKVAATTAF